MLQLFDLEESKVDVHETTLESCSKSTKSYLSLMLIGKQIYLILILDLLVLSKALGTLEIGLNFGHL